MRMHAKTWLVPILFGVAVIVGCSMSGTSLIQVWTNPSYDQGSIDKILIIGMAEVDATRRLFEDEMAAHFQKKDIQAVPSFELLPRLPEANESGKEIVKSAIAGREFDTVLVTSLIDIETITTYVPGSTYVVADYWGPPQYQAFYPYYTDSYTIVHNPGYLVEDEVVRLQTNVYNVASESLIWAAVSETFNPASIEDAVRTFGAAVLNDLEKNKLLR